jgi:hypothetical protein
MASAMTISSGVISLKKSVSSSTLLTIIVGESPASSNSLRRDFDCEARTIRGIIRTSVSQIWIDAEVAGALEEAQKHFA